jgi:hypothetical protein
VRSGTNIPAGKLQSKAGECTLSLLEESDYVKKRVGEKYPNLKTDSGEEGGNTKRVILYARKLYT